MRSQRHQVVRQELSTTHPMVQVGVMVKVRCNEGMGAA